VAGVGISLQTWEFGPQAMYVCSISLSPGLASQLEVFYGFLLGKNWGENAKLDSQLAGHFRSF
jgi:hypothetical protein